MTTDLTPWQRAPLLVLGFIGLISGAALIAGADARLAVAAFMIASVFLVAT